MNQRPSEVSCPPDSGTGHRREVRTFVRREGRFTPAQRAGLERWYGRYGLDLPLAGPPWDLHQVFGRTAPVWLDIGFGNGDALVAMALSQSDRDHIGVEVHRPGVGRILNALADREIDNVRIVCGDALRVLREGVPPAALAGVRLFFPDPWPKKRHHKRRMVQPAWARLVASRLRPGGILQLATDWEDYARQMLDVLEPAPWFTNRHGNGGHAPDRGDRPPTRFERRGLSRGHAVVDLVYVRNDTPVREDEAD